MRAEAGRGLWCDLRRGRGRKHAHKRRRGLRHGHTHKRAQAPVHDHAYKRLLVVVYTIDFQEFRRARQETK